MTQPTKTMFDISFIDRTIRTTGLVLLIAFVFSMYSFGLWNSLAFFSGGIWGIVNLMLIKNLVQNVFTPNEINVSAVAITALIKFPLLFVSGYFLVTVEQFDVKALLYGFSLILVIMVLKAAGRLFLGLDAQGNNNSVQKVI